MDENGIGPQEIRSEVKIYVVATHIDQPEDEQVSVRVATDFAK